MTALSLYLIPTLSLATCTENEKSDMKSSGYSTSQISDICSEGAVEVDNSSTKKKGSYTTLRVGYKSANGTFKNEINSDTIDGDVEETGYELSFVVGTNRAKGFDFRPILTLQYSTGNLNNVTDSTALLFLGAFEFAYNINQFISPFIGFNGGIGNETFQNKQAGSKKYSLFAVQVDPFVGVSGDFIEHFGYYVKYGALYRNHAQTDDGQFISLFMNDLTIGLSYKF